LTQQQEVEAAPKLQTSSSKPYYKRAGRDSSSKFSRGGFRNYTEGRNAGAGTGTSRKQSTRSTNFASKNTASKRGPGGGGGAFGGIGMMPT